MKQIEAKITSLTVLAISEASSFPSNHKHQNKRKELGLEKFYPLMYDMYKHPQKCMYHAGK